MSGFNNLLIKHLQYFAPVVPFSLDSKNTFPLDLSVTNSELYDFDIESTEELANYIRGKIQQSGRKYAAGGYGEDRLIYRKSRHFGSGSDARTIHLGIDVWSEVHTSISAPLAGKVHSFRNNNNFGDYGPTIILEHQLEGRTFYTLYGHLSVDSLNGLSEGLKIQRGEKFAETGDVDENGAWPPHLHFQVMTDMLGNSGDFPGVASKNDWQRFKDICPDPAPLLGVRRGR